MNGPDYYGEPCECNGGPDCACPDCDHLDCQYRQAETPCRVDRPHSALDCDGYHLDLSDI